MPEKYIDPKIEKAELEKRVYEAIIGMADSLKKIVKLLDKK